MRYTIMILGFTLLSFSLLADDGISFAKDEYHPVTTERIVDPMTKKLFRGIINIATGIGELPRQLIVTSHHDGVIFGFTVGMVKGIIMTVIRTSSGAFDVVTFPSAAPRDYQSLISPNFVWE